ncbi:MAG: hypothetical protein BGO39_24525 [Chloroflexi bacterium 54-19]|nr:MAG: hypothetical protein BGO39_24525 [Chloroflexi bacterium 54-19]
MTRSDLVRAKRPGTAWATSCWQPFASEESLWAESQGLYITIRASGRFPVGKSRRVVMELTNLVEQF